jgi:hypothetical protein
MRLSERLSERLSDKLLEVTGVAERGDSPREVRHEPEASLSPQMRGSIEHPMALRG